MKKTKNQNYSKTNLDFSRIAIFGGSCTGKSSLALMLSKKHSFPCFHLDDIFWKENWEMMEKEEFQKKVQNILHSNEYWIIDGNYSSVRNDVLKNTTLAIILNPPLLITLWRLFLRTLGRNTNIKIGEITPLPIKIEENGQKEPIFSAYIELAKYIIKFKFKRFKVIKKECEEKLGEENVLVLKNYKKINKTVQTK